MHGNVILLQYFVLWLHSQTRICFHLKNTFHLIFIRMRRHITVATDSQYVYWNPFFFFTLVFSTNAADPWRGRPWSHQPAVKPFNDPAVLLGTASPDGTCSSVGSSFPLFLVLNVSSFVCMKMQNATLKTPSTLLHWNTFRHHLNIVVFSRKNFRRRKPKIFFYLKATLKGEKIN